MGLKGTFTLRVIETIKIVFSRNFLESLKGTFALKVIETLVLQFCNDLRKNIMFTKILNKDFLSSQPTMCRFINNVKDENVKYKSFVN